MMRMILIRMKKMMILIKMMMTIVMMMMMMNRIRILKVNIATVLII